MSLIYIYFTHFLKPSQQSCYSLDRRSFLPFIFYYLGIRMFAFSPRKNLITVEILKHSSPLILSLIPMMSWAEATAIHPQQLETIKVQE